MAHSSQVSIQPGGNSIVLSGFSRVRCDSVHWHGVKDVAAYTPSWHQVSLSWKITVTLSSVTGGELSLEIAPAADADFQKACAAATKTEKGGDWFYNLSENLAGLFTSQTNNFNYVMNAMLTSMYSNSFDVFQGAVNVLNTGNMFVFPGGQELKMRDPFFNNELDLIVKTQYEFY